MKIVYEAANIIDANLVKNALDSENIVAFVGGQYLTGAAGELPVAGLVNVMVATSDWPRARSIVEHIDAALSERRAHATSFGTDFDNGWLPDPA